MHPIRLMLAVLLGGFSSLIIAHPLAQALTAPYPADAGLFAVIAAPIIVALFVGLSIGLAGRPAPKCAYEERAGEIAQRIEVTGWRGRDSRRPTRRASPASPDQEPSSQNVPPGARSATGTVL